MGKGTVRQMRGESVTHSISEVKKKESSPEKEKSIAVKAYALSLVMQGLGWTCLKENIDCLYQKNQWQPK